MLVGTLPPANLVKALPQVILYASTGFSGGSDGQKSACNVGDLGSVTGLGRSSGERNGNSRQYSVLENSLDRETWRATVHGVTKNWTRLSNQHTHMDEDVVFVYKGILLFFSGTVVSDSATPRTAACQGLPVSDHLPEFAQVHVHCISDAVQPSHPLVPSSPSALNLSQHWGLFQ